MKSYLEHKLCIFEILILNSNQKTQILQKVCKKFYVYTQKILQHKIAVVNLFQIYYLKNEKKTC